MEVIVIDKGPDLIGEGVFGVEWDGCDLCLLLLRLLDRRGRRRMW